MAVLVIAGSGRGAGKTAVGCALMAALPELLWLAVKVTPHEHDLANGLWEELDRNSATDTGRYLLAGAAHAFLISNVPGEELVHLLTRTRNRLLETDSVLVESNRIDPQALARAGEPVLCLAVLSGLEAQWKASLRERIKRIDGADALVLTGGLKREQLPAELCRKIVFELAEGQWSSPELVRFVRERIMD